MYVDHSKSNEYKELCARANELCNDQANNESIQGWSKFDYRYD